MGYLQLILFLKMKNNEQIYHSSENLKCAFFNFQFSLLF